MWYESKKQEINIDKDKEQRSICQSQMHNNDNELMSNDKFSEVYETIVTPPAAVTTIFAWLCAK